MKTYPLEELTGEAGLAEVNEVLKLAEQCRPILAHQPPTRQGAVLGALVATWLAGHIAPNADELNREKTDKLREIMLRIFIEQVRRLIPEEEAFLLETKEGRTVWSSP